MHSYFEHSCTLSSTGHNRKLDSMKDREHEWNIAFSISSILHQANMNTTIHHRVPSHISKERCFPPILTRLELVLLVSSSGMGRNTARATQFAKMVNKMMISKVLDGEAQDHNNSAWAGLVQYNNLEFKSLVCEVLVCLYTCEYFVKYVYCMSCLWAAHFCHKCSLMMPKTVFHEWTFKIVSCVHPQ